MHTYCCHILNLNVRSCTLFVVGGTKCGLSAALSLFMSFLLSWLFLDVARGNGKEEATKQISGAILVLLLGPIIHVSGTGFLHELPNKRVKFIPVHCKTKIRTNTKFGVDS